MLQFNQLASGHATRAVDPGEAHHRTVDGSGLDAGTGLLHSNGGGPPSDMALSGSDGAPVSSCSAAIIELADKNIETVEGLASGEVLHPIQQAFLEHNAAQCGYCTAGIIMRAKALLQDNPQPSRDDIAAALDGHLCRCGAHPRILRAVERAAQLQRSQL